MEVELVEIVSSFVASNGGSMGATFIRAFLRKETGRAVGQICEQLETKYHHTAVSDRACFHVVHELIGFQPDVLDVNSLSVAGLQVRFCNISCLP